MPPEVSGKMVSLRKMSNPGELNARVRIAGASDHRSQTERHFSVVSSCVTSIPFGRPVEPDVKIT